MSELPNSMNQPSDWRCVVSFCTRTRNRNTNRLTGFGMAFLLGCLSSVYPSVANAQETSTTSTSSLEEVPLDDIQDQYSQAAEKLRSAMKRVQASSVRFFNEASEQSEVNREAWQKAVDEGKSHIESLRATAMELFWRQDRPSDDIIDLALRSCLQDIRDERYRVGLKVLKRANSIRPTLKSETFMARVQLFDNEFVSAKQFFDLHPDAVEEMTEAESSLYDAIDELISEFDRETQIRKAEKAADDLPRVELITTEGRIVLELFENEAPETVSNFVHLVEQGYYNGVIFHNVKAEFVAQAGGFGVAQIDGAARILPKGVRYMIYDEHDKPEARKHFRGSLSMANQNSPDTGSSQFFLSLTPQPFLNENHTVFGRIVEGLDVMANLTINFKEDDKGKEEPVEGAIPSMILSAKVIRKRDHEYQPVVVGSKTDASTKSPKADSSSG
jgi:cyclophilin family peptidyl-prolyl cis-trans isomerase